MNKYAYVLFLCAVTAGAMWVLPKYHVYEARLEGQATLERAKGEAEANRILSESLKDKPEVLNYLFVRELGSKRGTIYVPTESNLPILEATRRMGGQTKGPGGGR